MEYAHTTRKTRQKYNNSFHEIPHFQWKYKRINVFTFTVYTCSEFYQFYLKKGHSSEIEPAVRFFQTLPTGYLQQDVVNPLSPNIHMQNLQTDLYTFPSRIS